MLKVVLLVVRSEMYILLKKTGGKVFAVMNKILHYLTLLRYKILEISSKLEKRKTGKLIFHEFYVPFTVIASDILIYH